MEPSQLSADGGGDSIMAAVSNLLAMRIVLTASYTCASGPAT